MSIKENTTMGLSIVMVMIAAMALVFGEPKPAFADCAGSSCEFASQCYSHGACAQLDCGSGKGQLCWHASWGQCETCVE